MTMSKTISELAADKIRLKEARGFLVHRHTGTVRECYECGLPLEDEVHLGWMDRRQPHNINRLKVLKARVENNKNEDKPELDLLELVRILQEIAIERCGYCSIKEEVSNVKLIDGVYFHKFEKWWCVKCDAQEEQRVIHRENL